MQQQTCACTTNPCDAAQPHKTMQHPCTHPRCAAAGGCAALKPAKLRGRERQRACKSKDARCAAHGNAKGHACKAGCRVDQPFLALATSLVQRHCCCENRARMRARVRLVKRDEQPDGANQALPRVASLQCELSTGFIILARWHALK